MEGRSFVLFKTLHTCFKRRIWLYDRGNYNPYREKLQRVDWDELINSGPVPCPNGSTDSTIHPRRVGLSYSYYFVRN
jgi:hypothetical protein